MLTMQTQLSNQNFRDGGDWNVTDPNPKLCWVLKCVCMVCVRDSACAMVPIQESEDNLGHQLLLPSLFETRSLYCSLPCMADYMAQKYSGILMALPPVSPKGVYWSYRCICYSECRMQAYTANIYSLRHHSYTWHPCDYQTKPLEHILSIPQNSPT